LQDELAVLESRLFELAGHPLNLASRQQLSQVIFQELGVQPADPKYNVPKTKATGMESTKEVGAPRQVVAVLLVHQQS
jgi:DNA polymerase-1